MVSLMGAGDRSARDWIRHFEDFVGVGVVGAPEDCLGYVAGIDNAAQ